MVPVLELAQVQVLVSESAQVLVPVLELARVLALVLHSPLTVR